jgi:hypothetical protein
MAGQLNTIEDDLGLLKQYDERLPYISFDNVHVENPNDEWFIARNHDLYDMACGFANEWFGDIDFPCPTEFRGSAWNEDLGVQFKEYSKLVAHADGAEDWENILRSKEERIWLIVGMLAQLIEKRIYYELLFGATPDQVRELEKGDLAFMLRDGKLQSNHANNIKTPSKCMLRGVMP